MTPTDTQQMEALAKELRHAWRCAYNRVHCHWDEAGKTFKEHALCDCDTDAHADPLFREVARHVLAREAKLRAVVEVLSEDAAGRSVVNLLCEVDRALREAGCGPLQDCVRTLIRRLAEVLDDLPAAAAREGEKPL